MRNVIVRGGLNVRGSLVLDNLTDEFPINPKPGTFIVKGTNLYGYVSISGLETWYPLIRDLSKFYVHTQGVASATWTITHNLSTDTPWFIISNSDGTLVQPAGIERVSADVTKFFFSEPIIGNVVLVGPSDLSVPTINTSLLQVGDDLVISTAGITYQGQSFITGTNQKIGDGSVDKFTVTNTQRLNFVPGAGVELAFDDTAKSITINAPGASVTPTVLNNTVTAAVDTLAGTVNSNLALKADITYVDSNISTLSSSTTTALGTKANSADVNIGLSTKANSNDVNAALALKLDSTEVVTVAAANKVMRLNGLGKLPADITGNAATASVASSINFSDVLNVPTTNAVLGLTDVANIAGNVAQDFSAKTITVAGNIVPSDALQTIGDATHRFKEIWAEDMHISTNTLYIGDTPFLGTTGSTVNIAGGSDQSVGVTTVGTGVTNVTSETAVNVSTTVIGADVALSATGTGSDVNITAAHQLNIVAPATIITGDASVTGNSHVTGDLTVTGTIAINGGVFNVTSAEVSTADNLIVVNAGQVGSGVTRGFAGIQVDRGDATDYQIVFDETDDMFKVGMVGDLQTIASQNYVATTSAPLVHSHSNATTIVSGYMSSTDKTKLDGVAASANNYSLPTASNTVLGGVKVGSGLSIDGAGVLSAAGATNIGQGTNTDTAVLLTSSTGTGTTIAAVTTTVAGVMSATDKVKLDGIATGATNYTLPKATTLALGGVKPDGTSITVDVNGVISGASTYSLPTASTTVVGGVKVDGTSITITDGVIASAGGVGSGTNLQINSLGVGTAPSTTAGEIRATGNITGYYSDARLKDVLGSIPNALDKVCSLSGVLYTGNSIAKSHGFADKEVQVGVLAQQVKNVLPQVVCPAPFDIGQNEDGTEYSISGENYMTVRYERIVPLLIEAIKELSIQIDSNKNTILRLESELNEVKNNQ